MEKGVAPRELDLHEAELLLLLSVRRRQDNHTSLIARFRMKQEHYITGWQGYQIIYLM